MKILVKLATDGGDKVLTIGTGECSFNVPIPEGEREDQELKRFADEVKHVLVVLYTKSLD